MRVVHDMVKTFDVPVERLRFDPDPLGLNEREYPRRVTPTPPAEPIVSGEIAVKKQRSKPPVSVYDVHGGSQPIPPPRPRPIDRSELPPWVRRVIRLCAISLAIVLNLSKPLWTRKPRLRVVREG